MTLRDAPSILREPAFGTYRGESAWGLKPSRKDRLLREKKWQWFGVASPDVFVGAAIVATGYAATTFVWVFDRREKRMVCDHSMTLLRSMVSVADAPAPGAVASVAAPGAKWSIDRRLSMWNAAGRLKNVRFDIELEERSTPMTAVCPTGQGRYNITRKSVGLPASGTVTVGDTTWSLEHATGMLDHSHGLMDRDTSWLWAIGSAPEPAGILGFNLISGFNDGLESVIWTANGLEFVGECEFDFPADPRQIAPWTVRSPDGRVDLRLDVEGVRDEDTNLGVVISRYAQPLGRWSGSLLGQEVDMPGVAEHHVARW